MTTAATARNLPAIGFGGSPARRGGERVDLETAFRVALRTGYRLFDLAEIYGTESALGRVLREPAAPGRNELFLVGKVWRTNFRPAALHRACEESLARLGCESFDLYLLHAPEAWRHVAMLGDPESTGWAELERRAIPRDASGHVATDAVPLAETWGAMQDLLRRGLVARVGVSNFDTSALDALDALGTPQPFANQFESNPYRPGNDLVATCAARGIVRLGHSPLSGEGLLDEPAVRAVASAVRRSPAQVVLRWNLERGVAPLPSSTNETHIAENFRAVEFELGAEAMRALDALSIP